MESPGLNPPQPREYTLCPECQSEILQYKEEIRQGKCFDCYSREQILSGQAVKANVIQGMWSRHFEPVWQ